MNTKILENNNKIIKLIHNRPKLNLLKKNDTIVVFLDGLENKPTPNQLDNFIDSNGGLIFNYLNLKGISCAKFRWFCSSLDNKDFRNVKVSEYNSELRLVLNYLTTKGFSDFIFVTTSFGSIPAFLTSQQNEFNITKIIFMGPVFQTSVQNLKHRLNNSDSFIYNGQNEINSQYIKDYLIGEWSFLNNLNYKSNNEEVDFLIIQGENEFEFNKENNLSFSKQNGSELVTISNAGHLVYIPSIVIDDDDFRKKQNILWDDLKKIIYEFIIKN